MSADQRRRQIDLEQPREYEEEKSILPDRDVNQSVLDKSINTARNLLTRTAVNSPHTENLNHPRDPEFQNQPLLSATPFVGKRGDHSTFLRDPIIRSSFPFTEKTAEAAVRLLRWRSPQSYVDMITNPRVTLQEGDRENFNSRILQIQVNETSHLEMDPNVIHPHVRIHIVNIQTGEYLKKTRSNAISHCEKLTFIHGKECTDSEIDFIPPFATNCCDLRVSGNTRARWTDKIMIDEDAANICTPDTVILFELLDFNKKLVNEGSEELDSDLNYRIAWGYIRPVGAAKHHFGMSKIQLYKYKFYPNSPTRAALFRDNRRVPYVYFDFLWPRKKNYDGYLSIQLLLIPRPPIRYTTDDHSRNIFEVEGMEQGLNISKRFQEIKRNVDMEDPEYIKKQRLLRKRRRNYDEECVVPRKVIFRFQTSPLGCLRLAFSPDGRYLAAACTYESSKTVVKVFNVEDGVLIYTLKGHKNLVHDLDWSSDSLCLVSGSSDFNCKIWHIPREEPSEEIDEEDSERNHFVYTLSHPSYIYSCKFFNDKSQLDRRVVATACFDGKVRIWLLETEQDPYTNQLRVRDVSVVEKVVSLDDTHHDQFQNLLDHRHPNCLKFDENGRIYVGDSLGMVHVWDIEVRFRKLSISKIRVVAHKEFEGDPINSISLLPFDKRRIIIHSRDNCVRSVDYSHANSTRVINRYFGSKSNKFPIRSCTSPDGQYILAGSEDGRPYLWDVVTTEQENVEDLQLSWVGPIADVAWNQEYHMTAFAGFGDEYPILVYCHEKDQNELEDMKVLSQIKNQKSKEGFENLPDSPNESITRKRPIKDLSEIDESRSLLQSRRNIT